MEKLLFDKVLIANRGEIALRIMRTVKSMGMKAVAVYSEADTNSLHVQRADEAVYIGPSPATESYLSIENMMRAIRKSGAQAVHPGYGFLSENTAFAEALKQEGVTLIGPSPNAIQKMGDKIEAKLLANKAGVSTIPGYMGVIKDADEAVRISLDIGFPVMLKAAAGGGGRGMRVVRNESEVREAFRSASNEAKNSFHDERVFIEKFIEEPRHIEIQLLADQAGNMVCLGERECSIQRHHQKVIEEAPSPFIDDETREKMYAQVRALAENVGYYSAGTVEFIMDKEKNFYFLEMNTRLQVEHCVTELVTGVDIVEQMIRVAAGQDLPFTQKDVDIRGWAIESRIYAEDPARGFLPSSGRIVEYQEPEEEEGIRIDSGVYEGGEVSMFYDPMIAKLCTYGMNREEALTRMREALGGYVIRGVSHNIPFLEAIMAHQRFIDGQLSTNFIAQEYPDGFLSAELTSEVSKIFLAVATHIHLTDLYRATTITGQLPGRERQISTRWVVSIDGTQYPVSVEPDTLGHIVYFEKEVFTVHSSWILGSSLFRGTINGKAVNVQIKVCPGGYELTHAGTTSRIMVRTPRVAELERFMPLLEDKAAPTRLETPITGMVVKLNVGAGDEVKIGQELIVVEAMKMENVICAERAGSIESIHVEEGQSVSSGDLLLEYAA